MKISTVIPAYNSAAFIHRSLDSVAAQTRPVDEIIVVDDGSTDDTMEAVRQWEGPVTLISQPNQGPSAARNRGIEAASGDWIAFLDADDQWTPNRIEQQIAILEKYPQLHLVASDMREIDEEGNTLTPSVLQKHRLLEHFQRLDGKPVPQALAFLMRKNFIPTGTVLARRDTLLESGLFNTEIRFGEDLELWARIAARQAISCLPRVHMLRLQHGGNATGNTLAMLQDLVSVNRSVRRQAGEILRKQGTDPDELVANALWELGYWHFSHHDYGQARSCFLSSLREHPSRRALLHTLAAHLPRSVIRLAQTIRHSGTC